MPSRVILLFWKLAMLDHAYMVSVSELSLASGLHHTRPAELNRPTPWIHEKVTKHIDEIGSSYGFRTTLPEGQGGRRIVGKRIQLVDGCQRQVLPASGTRCVENGCPRRQSGDGVEGDGLKVGAGRRSSLNQAGGTGWDLLLRWGIPARICRSTCLGVSRNYGARGTAPTTLERTPTQQGRREE
jgi:hypothetical protein